MRYEFKVCRMIYVLLLKAAMVHMQPFCATVSFTTRGQMFGSWPDRVTIVFYGNPSQEERLHSPGGEDTTESCFVVECPLLKSSFCGVIS